MGNCFTALKKKSLEERNREFWEAAAAKEAQDEDLDNEEVIKQRMENQGRDKIQNKDVDADTFMNIDVLVKDTNKVSKAPKKQLSDIKEEESYIEEVKKDFTNKYTKKQDAKAKRKMSESEEEYDSDEEEEEDENGYTDSEESRGEKKYAGKGKKAEYEESDDDYSYGSGNNQQFEKDLSDNRYNIKFSIDKDLANEIDKLVTDFTIKYKPKPKQIESKLQAFVPDYIPAVDTVDPFIKPPRPDRKYEKVGLTMLDFPNKVNFPDALQQGYNDLLEQYLQEQNEEEEYKDEQGYDSGRKSYNEIQADKNPLARQKSQDHTKLPKIQIMCKICFAKEANTLFIPCGHLGACESCANQIIKSTSRCPFDNKKVSGFNKVFIA